MGASDARTRLTFAFVAAFVALSSFCSRAAVADDGGRAALRLDTARRALESGGAAEARRHVDTLVQAGGLEPDELAEAYEVRGLAFAAQGDEAAAQAAFFSMITVDAEREPTGTHAARAQWAFLSARRARGHVQPLRIEVETVRWRGGDGPVLSAGVFGDSAAMVARLDLHCRRRGDIVPYGTERLAPTGRRSISPRALARGAPSGAECWAEGLDAHGNRVVAWATPDTPRALGPTGEPTDPAARALARSDGDGADGRAPRDDRGGGISSKWWFWGGLAALAAGSIVAAVALSGGDGADDVADGCFGGPCDAVVGPTP